MNLNLGTLLFAFLASLGVHSALILAIANPGGGIGDGLSGIITVEIISSSPDSSAMLGPDHKSQAPETGPESAHIYLVPKPHKVKKAAPPAPAKSGDSASLPASGFFGPGKLILLRAPKPSYPDSARRLGIAGNTLLELEIVPSGEILNAAVLTSSGSADCDTAAQETILREWRFAPQAQLSATQILRQRVLVKFQLEE